jgi:hypothetical protein
MNTMLRDDPQGQQRPEKAREERPVAFLGQGLDFGLQQRIDPRRPGFESGGAMRRATSTF